MLWMEVATTPGTALNEPFRGHMAFAVLFPVSSRIGMAVQRKDEGANWVAHPFPCLWPFITRKEDPSRGATELGLSVCLLCVGLLNGMALEQAVCISDLTGLHSSRAT